MARPKSKGAYVPLAAHYFMDDAILEAGPEAELLFVRTLSFMASVPSDGFITERQLRTVVAVGLKNVSRRLSKLIEVGLLEEQSGGYLARSWSKWNRSADEVGRLLAKDRARKAQKHGDAEGNSGRNPDGIQSDSEDQSSTEQSSTKNSSSPRGDGAFGEFYMAYPRKVGKEAARKRFATVTKTVDPVLVIDGARRFAADPNLPADKNFIPHPASWLGAGRWEDEPLPPRRGGPPPDDFGNDEWMMRA